jgi:hypothetical protein
MNIFDDAFLYVRDTREEQSANKLILTVVNLQVKGSRMEIEGLIPSDEKCK